MRLKGFSNTCEEDGKHSLSGKKKKKSQVCYKILHIHSELKGFFFFFFFCVYD